jgi:hypothetical protein
MQQFPSSITKNIASETAHADVSEQRHQFLESTGKNTQVLGGWKDIANYMHRGVRTVQRWERLGLPVRRLTNHGRSPVLALAQDLDAWWARSLHVPLLDRIEELTATISSLEAKVRSLEGQLLVRNRPIHRDRTPGLDVVAQSSRSRASEPVLRSRPHSSSPLPSTTLTGGQHERIQAEGLA